MTSNASQCRETPIAMNRLVSCIESTEGASWNSDGGGLRFTRSTWEEHTDLPYSQSCDKDDARATAQRVLIRTRVRLLKEGVVPTVYLLALRWYLGYDGMLKAMHLPASRYATEITNLYNQK